MFGIGAAESGAGDVREAEEEGLGVVVVGTEEVAEFEAEADSEF